MENNKKLFWLVAAAAAVASIAAAVAVFVTKYLRKKQEVEELTDYCEELESECCGCDDVCGCDECSEAEENPQ
ncbi:MAG: hypothetical protein ACI4QV_04785 [Acutalibacteraceae bacterium]